MRACPLDRVPGLCFRTGPLESWACGKDRDGVCSDGLRAFVCSFASPGGGK